MNRRKFIKTTAAGSMLLSVPYIRSFAQPLPEHPNVLMIIIEDLNSWVGCMGGHPDAYTPNLDAFASDGVLFSNAHVNAAACNPSRTAIFSGLRPSTSGVYYNTTDWRNLIPDDHPMLPQLFQQSGYQTVHVGKAYGWFSIHSHWDLEYNEDPPTDLPGDEAYLPDHPGSMVNSANSNSDMLWGPNDVPESSITDYKLVQQGLDLFQSGLQEPFFMVFGTNRPHQPMIIPRRFIERYNPATIELPPFLPDDLADVPPAGADLAARWLHNKVVKHKQWRKAVAYALATHEYIDHLIGMLLQGFQDSGYADNSIVLIVSDHGQHFGEKKHWRKKTLWEEATRSYLAWRVPGVTSQGGICGEAVAAFDIYPTLQDLCNLDNVPAVEASNLMPQLINPDQPRTVPAMMTWGPGNHAIRDERWRYIRYSDNSEELYDHQQDPHEWTNLADNPQYADIKAYLAQWLPDDG